MWGLIGETGSTRGEVQKKKTKNQAPMKSYNNVLFRLRPPVAQTSERSEGSDQFSFISSSIVPKPAHTPGAW